MNEQAQATWTLSDWLTYLEQQHHKSIDLGLERIGRVANALSADRPADFVITVAGTNGKGSTVRYLEHILLANGQQVATYTSPHFLRYNERVRINGQELGDEAHCEAFRAVEAARGNTTLTYFEFGTLAALWLIARAKVDVAILEIGLGGRLDAVNLVDPDVAVVTSVGVDHVEFLGNDREDIGYEKAGVYRTGKPAICADPMPPQRLLAHAEAISAPLYLVDAAYQQVVEDECWHFYSESWQLERLPLPSLPLANAATALMALALVPYRVTREAVVTGLQAAKLPGRMQVWSQSPLVILDVAHNPHAAAYLAASIAARYPNRSLRAVCGMLKDKDIAGTLESLQGVVRHWYFASIPGPRGASAEQLAAQTGADDSQTCQLFANVAQAYEQALTDAEEGDIVLCFGSFLTIQAIYELEG